MLFALDICVSKKDSPTHSVHGVSISHSHLKICKLSNPAYLGYSLPPTPPKNNFFMQLSPSPLQKKSETDNKKKIFSELP